MHLLPLKVQTGAISPPPRAACALSRPGGLFHSHLHPDRGWAPASASGAAMTLTEPNRAWCRNLREPGPSAAGTALLGDTVKQHGEQLQGGRCGQELPGPWVTRLSTASARLPAVDSEALNPRTVPVKGQQSVAQEEGPSWLRAQPCSSALVTERLTTRPCSVRARLHNPQRLASMWVSTWPPAP